MEKKKPENVHAGHRDRMRKRFREIGFEGWAPHEVLEFMLFNVYQRQDTNEIAHRLINHSGGTLKKVFENSFNKSLLDIDDVGLKTVEYLRTIKLFMDYYHTQLLLEESVQVTRDSFAHIVSLFGFKSDSEDIFIICADRYMVVKYLTRIGENATVQNAFTSIGEIQRIAINSAAENVILLHNHPSGSPNPSQADVQMTVKADSALSAIGVRLVDHYILCDGQVTSIKMTISLSQQHDSE